MNRYFEMVDATTNTRKFYRVEVRKGTSPKYPGYAWSLWVTYGRIGTAGKEEHVDSSQDRTSMERVAEYKARGKIAKGYVEISGAPGTATAAKLTPKQELELMSLLGDLDEMASKP